MEQHFANRPTQAQQQQHVYSTSPYSVFSSQQQPYLTGGYQGNTQHQPVAAYPQVTNHYNRQGTPAHSSNMQQRRGGNLGANNGGGMNRGSMMQSGGGHAGAAPMHHQLSGGNGASEPHPPPIAAVHQVSQGYPKHHRTVPSQDLPLRMVVDAKYVGAIIGQAGANIREITKDSKARCVVDTQRAVRDPSGVAEKVISILGQPENCTRACYKILEVVRREMEKDNAIAQHPEVELKIRAHNQLVGRLIGKGGATIKKIMEETGATVFVSNEPAMPREVMGMLPPYGGPPPFYAADLSMHMERTITVKAPDLNTVSAAEQKISQKLRQSYEADMSSRVIYPCGAAAGAIPLMAPLSSGDSAAYMGAAAGIPPPHLSRATAANAAAAAAAAVAAQQTRTVRMWVPNSMVGALIGAKGAHIRNVMRMTGAHVRIEGGGEKNKEKKERADSKEKEAKEAAPAEDSENAKKEDGNSAELLSNLQISENSDTDGSEKAEKKPDTVEENSEKAPAKAADDEKEKGKEKDKENEKDKEKEKEKESDQHLQERLVTIIGNEHQQYRAQFWVYQRVSEQSCHYIDEVRLCTEVAVPSKLVGRIIGKGGQNVRELQRITGAQVKIPDDAGEDESQETTNVRVLGNFQASQAVQARLTQLVHEFAHRLSLYPGNGQPASGAQGSSPGAKEGAAGATPATTTAQRA